MKTMMMRLIKTSMMQMFMSTEKRVKLNKIMCSPRPKPGNVKFLK